MTYRLAMQNVFLLLTLQDCVLFLCFFFEYSHFAFLKTVLIK